MSQLGRLGAAGTTLVVVGTLLASCGRTAVPPQAAATPQATDTAAAQVSGSGLIWYLKGSAALFSTDWAGHRQSGFAMPAAPPNMPHYPGKPAPTQLYVMSVSPDGSRLLLSDGSIRDPEGAKVGQLDQNAGLTPTWSDDNRHLCQMTTPGYRSFTGGTLTGPAILTWVTPGSASRAVATVGQFGPNADTTVEACSARSGVAVLAERTASGITQAARTGLDPVTKLVVINLSDGSVLYEREYKVTSNPVGGTLVTVSSDGRHVAEVYTAVRQGPSAPVQIRELPQGTVRATIGTTNVQGFSGDDHFAFLGGGSAPEGQIVDWRTREVHRTELGVLVVSASQPDGSAFMVLKRATSVLLANDLWLIPASGPSRLVDTDIVEVFGNT